jgi:predicted metal-dependent hydrolase
MSSVQIIEKINHLEKLLTTKLNTLEKKINNIENLVNKKLHSDDNNNSKKYFYTKNIDNIDNIIDNNSHYFNLNNSILHDKDNNHIENYIENYIEYCNDDYNEKNIINLDEALNRGPPYIRRMDAFDFNDSNDQCLTTDFLPL